MNEVAAITWDPTTEDLTTAVEPIIFDIMVDGQRCIYIADAPDDGI